MLRLCRQSIGAWSRRNFTRASSRFQPKSSNAALAAGLTTRAQVDGSWYYVALFRPNAQRDGERAAFSLNTVLAKDNLRSNSLDALPVLPDSCSSLHHHLSKTAAALTVSEALAGAEERSPAQPGGQVRDSLVILTLNSSFEGFATRPTAASYS